MKSNFNYESKPFGVGQIRLQPWYIPALKLRYALVNLKNVRGRVLEVGCGGGAMTKAIKFYRPDLDVYGCDISRNALAFGKKDSNGVKFLYGDLYKLPFKDQYFDAVVSFDVFEHLENLDKAISETKRVLKKNGTFHLAIPYEGSLLNIEGWLYLFGWRAKEIYCGHVNKFRVGELENLLEKSGFKLTQRRFSTHLFSQIPDALYFSIIYIRGKNFPYQIEGYVSLKKGFFRNIIYLSKNIYAAVSYVESTLLFWFPGLTGHLTLIKNN